MRPVFLVVSVIAFATLPAALPRTMAAQDDLQKVHEQEIKKRLQSQNGIGIGELKLYDDSLLQQMLTSAETKLATIQALDQTGITAKIGAISGAEQRTTSVALNVQTPSLPEVTTTEKAPTESTVTKTSASGTTTDTTSNIATTDVVTKQPQTAAPTATPAPPGTTMPSSFSVSASDLLNEQMQLTFEIANLRLLLDGALSDRMFTADKDQLHRLKPRHTIGVPIIIDTKSNYKNAVAVVEVEIERTRTIAETAGLSLTALLPREKTYNVAAIRESNVNLGGGVTTQIVGVSGGFLKARKTYYIVQDQDTLSQTFEPQAKHTLGVAWLFRPVLGQEYVRPRQTQMFVQVAFPTEFGACNFAKVRVRSYWRRYDRKHGIAKDVIKGSLNEKIVDGKLNEWNIPSFPSTIPKLEFNQNNLEDLGGGQMLVNVPTRLMSGTTLRVGSTILKDGAAGTFFSQAGVKFVASIADLASKQVALVGRDGQETPLLIRRQQLTQTSDPLPQACPVESEDGKEAPGAAGANAASLHRAVLVDLPPPKIERATAVSLDETTSLVEVRLAQKRVVRLPEEILVIGGRVFGYSDAPITRNEQSFVAIVPTALIQQNPSVLVTALFAPKEYRDATIIEGITSRSRNERLVVLEESGGQTKLLLYGSRLNGAKILVPSSATLTAVPDTHQDDKEVFGLVTVKSDDLKGLKQLVLQRAQERPLFITLPATEAPKKPDPKPRERIVVNADAAVFDSDGLADLTGVTFEKKALPAAVAKDKKSVTVSGLRAAGVTAAAGTVQLEFAFGETKIPVKLEIVSARVETISK